MALELTQPPTEMSTKGLDSWPLKIDLTLLPHYGPGVDSACNRNPTPNQPFGVGFLTPWRWDQQAVPKRRQEITTTRSVITQKSAVFICFASETWNHAGKSLAPAGSRTVRLTTPCPRNKVRGSGRLRKRRFAAVGKAV